MSMCCWQGEREGEERGKGREGGQGMRRREEGRLRHGFWGMDAPGFPIELKFLPWTFIHALLSRAYLCVR